jgi:hypothetical protein
LPYPGKTEAWPIPTPLSGDAERIFLWARLISGLDLDANRRLQPVKDQIWERFQSRLKEAGGPPMP